MNNAASVSAVPYVTFVSNWDNAEYFARHNRTASISIPEGMDERTWHSTVVHGRASYVPYYHLRSANPTPVASLRFRSYVPHHLEQFTHFAAHAAAALGIPISRPAPLPIQRRLWTVPRGPFAHKKSQENFERKVHGRAVKVWDADGEVVEAWLRYLRKHRMGSVGVRVTRWQRAPVGIGQQILERTKENLGLMKKAQASEEQVRELAEKIVRQELGQVEGQARIEEVKVEPKAS